jgi:hypothetical protein
VKSKIAGRLDYGRFSGPERARLWARSVDRGDADEAARLLRTCPKKTGAVRDVTFIAAAVALHPELAVEVVGLDESRGPERFTVVVEQLPASIDALREILRVHEDRNRSAS